MIFNFTFLLILIIATLYLLLKDQELSSLFAFIKEAKKGYLLLGLGMVFIFVCSESLIIHYLMNSLSYSVKLLSCIKYSFVGFFVSLITPSATGGQPAQVYYMSGDGISGAVSTLVLMIVTIAYKAILLLMSLFMLITEYSFVMAHIGGIGFILLLGIVINVFMIAFLAFVIFKQSFAKKTIGNLILWLGKKGLIKNYHHKVKRVLATISKYDNSAIYLKEHKVVLFNTFFITLIQRIALFLITFFVYKSFGLSGTSAYQIVTLQTLIALSVDNIPLPGGVGANEGIFMIFFQEIFTPTYLTAGLLLTRGFNYYLIIILGALVTLYAQIVRKKRIKKVTRDKA